MRIRSRCAIGGASGDLPRHLLVRQRSVGAEFVLVLDNPPSCGQHIVLCDGVTRSCQ